MRPLEKFYYKEDECVEIQTAGRETFSQRFSFAIVAVPPDNNCEKKTSVENRKTCYARGNRVRLVLKQTINQKRKHKQYQWLASVGSQLRRDGVEHNPEDKPDCRPIPSNMKTLVKEQPAIFNSMMNTQC
ncbi:hypothetical protein EVAR_100657_1 [Eumeta japonica]|uniref:Uncharacterized protein n=1 Tax=Eumeta variegata TaxID=151549 RepID=A0A4C1ZPN4_EUMVA|nr:hypothetical protein EVAR_100657_1 [Eumeta japonica]